MQRERIHSKIKSLVSRFEANKYHYLSKNYLEEEVKIDFINALFEALGWDIRNTEGLSPYERDVVVEKGETLGRPDYNFRIDGQTKFFVEAKAPHEPLHKINHVLQAKSYAWNTKSVFTVLLTDFEEFRLFDATIKPDPKNAEQGLIFELTYDQFLDNLDKLVLLSKEEVEKGSLDKLLLKDSESKKLRKPVDEAFLEDISKWREELAKDIYKNNIKDLEDTSDEGKTKIQVKILNEAVQKILDRLIFIRIAEDRKMIEPKSLLDDVEWWKASGKRRDLQRRLINRFMGWNQDFNGEILKPGPCDVLEISSGLLAKIIEGLYFPKCPYRFEVIGVALLGSIYERYLGKTIRVTPQRVKIEEKPEVRKAGGVYYTPQYIVDYIVKNTVGKKIEGKTPRQIERISILDPACGSGSFLLTAFQTLIDFHLDYYEKHPGESGEGKLFPDLIIDFNGTKRLSIEKKAQILKNNIFGVDIDPQAVEIAMMSLYLKCLEGEKDLPRKKELLPSLEKNIRCGNSLISYDFFNQLDLFDEELKDNINPFNWYSKSTGFGQILENEGFNIVIGNPPWIQAGLLTNYKEYFELKYGTYSGNSDIYVFFIERSYNLLNRNGIFGMIVSSKWLRADYGKKLRKFLSENVSIKNLLDFGELPVFRGAGTFPCIIIFESRLNKKAKTIYSSIKSLPPENRIEDQIQKHGFSIVLTDPTKTEWTLVPSPIQEILNKIRNRGTPLGDYYRDNIRRGGVTGYNPSFMIEEKTRNRLIKEDNSAKDIIKPFVSGDETRRYSINWERRYIIFTRRGIDIARYPSILKHLSLYKENLKPKKNTNDKTGRKPGKYKWYEIQDSTSYYKDFKKTKIVYGQFQIAPHFCVSLSELYFGSNHYMIILDNLTSLFFLCGILNSRLYFFYMKSVAGLLGDADKKGRLISQKSHMLKFPVLVPDFSNNKVIYNKLTELVNTILELNKMKIVSPPGNKRYRIERDIQVTNERIDELVYELYGITEEEIKIIEE